MNHRSVKHMEDTVRRGDIFYADLSPVVGSEQGGTRPVLIVQNDTGNRHSPTVIGIKNTYKPSDNGLIYTLRSKRNTSQCV